MPGEIIDIRGEKIPDKRPLGFYACSIVVQPEPGKIVNFIVTLVARNEEEAEALANTYGQGNFPDGTVVALKTMKITPKDIIKALKA